MASETRGYICRQTQTLRTTAAEYIAKGCNHGTLRSPKIATQSKGLAGEINKDSPFGRFDPSCRIHSQSPPLPIPPQQILGLRRIRVHIHQLDQHPIPLVSWSVFPGEVTQDSVQGIPWCRVWARRPEIRHTPQQPQRYFGKPGAGDGGETLFDKCARSSGLFVIQRKGNFAEVGTARE